MLGFAPLCGTPLCDVLLLTGQGFAVFWVGTATVEFVPTTGFVRMIEVEDGRVSLGIAAEIRLRGI